MFENYLAGWLNHADGTRESRDAMQSNATADVIYDDIHNEMPWRGAAGLEEVCQTAHSLFSELIFTIDYKIVTSEAWTLEWTAKGTHRPSNKPFEFRGASVGRLTVEGRVSRHTDYWNASLLEAQVGPLAG